MVAGKVWRSAYPVRAKLAQYLIIFLLSNFSSSVAPSGEDNHKIWLSVICKKPKVPHTWWISFTSFLWLAPHPVILLILYLQILRLRATVTCPRSPGSEGRVWTHTFLVHPVLSQPCPRGCKFLGGRRPSLLSNNKLLYNTCSKYKVQNAERVSNEH